MYACLSMAREEMQEITVLDEALLLQHTHRLHMYFAEEDGWVGDNKAAILKVFQDDPEAIRIVHGHQDIPHAFCISKFISLNADSCTNTTVTTNRPWRDRSRTMS